MRFREKVATSIRRLVTEDRGAVAREHRLTLPGGLPIKDLRGIRRTRSLCSRVTNRPASVGLEGATLEQRDSGRAAVMETHRFRSSPRPCRMDSCGGHLERTFRMDLLDPDDLKSVHPGLYRRLLGSGFRNGRGDLGAKQVDAEC